jgi:hypothetical protein
MNAVILSDRTLSIAKGKGVEGPAVRILHYAKPISERRNELWSRNFGEEIYNSTCELNSGI